MRIGILTHPQGANYGGVLQCYALCRYLHTMGHDPIVIRRESDKSFFLWEWIRSVLKFLHFPRYYKPNTVDKTIHIRQFVEKHLNRTMPIRSQHQMRKVCRKYQLDTIIVGSDQVWRNDFALKFGYNYFLDFVPSSVKRISYAASFGLSGWRYTPLQTDHIKQLLTQFSAISVREKEAVSLCIDNLNVNAIHVVDPTLLLSSNDYTNITSNRLVNENYVFIYWLGTEADKQQAIANSELKDKRIADISLRSKNELISIENWLSYIKYADFVITDSFHGCVFSILFHKQFSIFSNHLGGNERLNSLLELLGINPSDGYVDYVKVDECLLKVREKSIMFLNNTLL